MTWWAKMGGVHERWLLVETVSGEQGQASVAGPYGRQIGNVSDRDKCNLNEDVPPGKPRD